MIAKFRYHSEKLCIAKFIVPLHPATTVPTASCNLLPASFFFFLFLIFSALLSSWSLIYNVEFDSSSSCLDRLNNVGMIVGSMTRQHIYKLIGTFTEGLLS